MDALLACVSPCFLPVLASNTTVPVSWTLCVAYGSPVSICGACQRRKWELLPCLSCLACGVFTSWAVGGLIVISCGRVRKEGWNENIYSLEVDKESAADHIEDLCHG